MFALAESLIQAAEIKGIDTRFMKRDYSVASDYWKRYDYAVARMYLERIVARKDEIPEGLVVAAACLCLCFVPGVGSRWAWKVPHTLS